MGINHNGEGKAVVQDLARLRAKRNDERRTRYLLQISI